uniref:Uncharacterized protein n=1 Tax=Arundo donax TaxID=35708 RepID=A0A0A9C6J4_ARUDO
MKYNASIVYQRLFFTETMSTNNVSTWSQKALRVHGFVSGLADGGSFMLRQRPVNLFQPLDREWTYRISCYNAHTMALYNISATVFCVQ